MGKLDNNGKLCRGGNLDGKCFLLAKTFRTYFVFKGLNNKEGNFLILYFNWVEITLSCLCKKLKMVPGIFLDTLLRSASLARTS